MDSRISLITLGVKDLENAKAFYIKLGFIPEENESDDIVFLKVGDMKLSLYPFSKLSEDIGVKGEYGNFLGITLAHNVESKEKVDEVIEEARAAGAEIVKEPQDVFWGGYSSYFKDLDGYYWEVAWNPFWKIKK